MPLFSKVFKSKDATKKVNASNTNGLSNVQPQWVDSWLRTRVDPEEVVELLHACTADLKSRALDIPFLLLPFRPSSDPSAAKSFVRNYFIPPNDRPKLKGNALINEIRMTEAMVLISVMKWCWARLPGGVVSWETYKMFKIGEKDSRYARDAFSTFIPISVDSKARVTIINDFFDLMAALAAHGKTNGLSGYKLSRYAGWWAFEHYDTGKGFEAGYKAWNIAANATCHLFFAYLRSMAPEPGKTNGILDLPRSLQHLVASTEYPPISSLLTNDTTKVVMVVDVVSPTPYALLRRAKNFEYRDDDRALQHFADYDDPIDSLTDECRRVLRAISSINQSQVSDAKTSTSLVDPSWSRFEDIGFSSALDDIGEDDDTGVFSFSTSNANGLGSTGRSPVMDLNRPTTPSWADFLSSGFTDEHGNRTGAPILLPPDKMLPPINTEPRGQSSQSHRRDFDSNSTLEPGELASITKAEIDDSFWWVWISSLAGEEPTSRKACFGRCAFIETCIAGGRWMVMEEQVKGAAPEPVQGAYIAEKKSFLGFTTKRGRLTRRRSAIKKSPLSPDGFPKSDFDPANTTALAPDQQAKIQKAAIALANKKRAEETATNGHNRRGRFDDSGSRNDSVFTLGPQIKAEASPALQWAKQYDKNSIRAHYLGNQLAGKGSTDFLTLPTNGLGTTRSTSTLYESVKEKDLPTVPIDEERSLQQEKRDEPVVGTHTIVTLPIESEHRKVPDPVSKTPNIPSAVVASPVQLPVQSMVPIANLPAVANQSPPRPAAPVSEYVEALPVIQHDQNVSSAQTEAIPSSVTSHSPEQTRKSSFQSDLSAAQRPNGIKRLFGTMRKNRDEPAAPPPAPKSNPSVAAARRALESKINPPKPEPVQHNFVKYKSVKNSATVPASVAAAPELIQLAPTPDPTPAPAPASSPVSIPVRPVTPVSQTVSKDPMIVAVRSKPELEPALPLNEIEYQPPKTRRDAEFDQLSRVDTREREQADREFSRFDQGPLLEQPAALPTDDSHHSFDDEHDLRSKHQSVYSAVTMDPETDDDDDDDVEGDNEDKPELTQEVSANDRWAQIRRNAAERAARFSEDHGNRSRTETRTDDGETSGEETIESRVARIKARVAELTGNMEGVRR